MNKNVEANEIFTCEELDNIRRMAEQGDAEAQFTLGEYYYESTWEEKETIPHEEAYREASKWFHKSAEQGHEWAQFRLGNCYALAVGVKYNREESDKWYRKAAEQGLAAAQCAVALHYSFQENDKQEAVKWFRLAAEQGDEFSLNELAYFYRNGIGVEKDEEKAAMLYKKLEEIRIQEED
mgnify:CR=1 FL=1